MFYPGHSPLPTASQPLLCLKYAKWSHERENEGATVANLDRDTLTVVGDRHKDLVQGPPSSGTPAFQNFSFCQVSPCQPFLQVQAHKAS